MKKSELSEVFRRTEARVPTRGALSHSTLMLTLCVVAIGACGQQLDPLQKAFDAVGGRETLVEFRGFAYESTGERFEAGQSLNPAAEPIRASSFDLSLLYDIENERLSFDCDDRSSTRFAVSSPTRTRLTETSASRPETIPSSTRRMRRRIGRSGRTASPRGDRRCASSTRLFTYARRR